MSDEEENTNEPFDLSFEPTWVNEPVNPYINKEYKGRRPRKERRSGGPRDRKGGGKSRRGEGRGPGAGGRRDERGKPRGGRRDERPSSPRRDRAPASRVPVDIAFVPARENLQSLVKRITSSQRAYSVFELAKLVLSKPEFHAVKVSVNAPEKSEAPPKLYACQKCRVVHTSKQEAVSHALRCVVDTYYEAQETEGEPPKGAFTCVVRCRLSKTLLGPPNHHGYNDRLRELHQERFSSMSMDDYRNKLETCHDEALVEQWKQEQSTQTTWRVRTPPEGEDEQTFARRIDMEAHFRSNYLERVIKSGSRFVMSGTVSLSTDSQDLARDVRGAWGKENKFPLKLSIALSTALKHSKMHVFKLPDGNRFVSAVMPAPMQEDAQATPEVQAIMDYLRANPDASRDALIASLLKDDESKADAMKAAFMMLVGRGHIIAFADGKVGLPPARKPKPASKKESAPAVEKPAEESVEKVKAEASADAPTTTEPEPPATEPSADTDNTPA